MTIIIDTNFLTVPVQSGIDIFTETERTLERRVEFHLLDSVVKEINRRFINPRDNKERTSFRVAKALMQRCKIVETPERLRHLPVDDQIIAYALQIKGIIATNDRGLRQRARRSKVPIIYIRGEKRIEIEGYIL